MSWRVLKFGGSSVGSTCGLRALLGIVARRGSDRTVVVVSALAGVTDQLQALSEAPEHADVLVAALRERHQHLLEAFADGPVAQWAAEQIEVQWQQVAALLDPARGPLGDAGRAALLACGERASAPLVTAALLAAGVEAVCIDACELLHGRGKVLDAEPLLQPQAATAVRKHGLLQSASLAVVPGFLANDGSGGVCLLGRGGSDTSATALAALLGAERVEIWTDVDGLADADPACVPDARVIARLATGSAQRLATEGARVLHPRSLKPAQIAAIPVHVRNTFRPEAPGTWIDAEEPTAVSALIGPFSEAGQARLSWVGDEDTGFDLPQCLQSHGFELSGLQREPGLQRVWLAPGQAIAALQAAYPALQQHLASVRVLPLAPARVARRESLSSGGEPEAVEVILAGPRGRVGSALLDHWNRLSAEAVVPLPRLRVGLAFDRHGAARDVDDLSSGALAARMQSSPARPWRELLAELLAAPHRPRVFVDVTASADVAGSYAELLEHDIAVVAANKLAFSATAAAWQRVHSLAQQKGLPLRYETSVAAAVPVLHGLRALRQRGECLRSLRAVLSGSLSFVLSRLHQGVAFSAAVREARDLGYTEPHPGEDLGLADVTRKLLIMLRESGVSIEPDQVHVSPLTAVSKPDPQAWLDALTAEDGEWAKRCAAAGNQGRRLVALAQWDGQRACVGLQALDVNDPLARLAAGENRVEVHSRWHQALPLVFAGPGAGPEVTAAGVWGDLLQAARSVLTRVAAHPPREMERADVALRRLA